MQPLALIVAVARGGVIGSGGTLPWRLPDESRHFRATTLGHCLIMGRKTWESLPGALPDRTSIVVTRTADYDADGALVASSLEAAIGLAHEWGDEEPIVAGGAALYKEALPIATRVWLTKVHADLEGDVYFPEWSADGWSCAHTEEHAVDERHAYAYTVEQWVRDADA